MTAAPPITRADQAQRTRAQILEISADLFSARTYTGTTMAEIAARLGTTKAALYHHFSSKEEILAELVTEPTAAFRALAASVSIRQPGADADDVISGLIDLFEGFPAISILFDSDPSALGAAVSRFDTAADVETVLAALAGPEPTVARQMRAHAALAAIRAATAFALADEQPISAETRADIVQLGRQILG